MLDYAYYAYINTKCSCNEKSYLISRGVHKNKTNPNIQLILKIKDKDDIIYAELLLALEEI